jgi:glycosyltransferase involved in cell wall biosynthesis
LLIARHPVGGIRTFFRYIYGRDEFADCRFTLIVPRSDFKDFAASAFQGKELTYCEVAPSTGALLRETWKQLRAGGYDLVHSHGFTAGTAAAIPARLSRVPHVMSVHDVLFASHFEGLKGALKRRALDMLYSGLDGVHAVGEDCRDNLRQFLPSLRADRLHTIRNGIDVRMFRSAQSRNLREELGLGNRQVLIGFFGRFMAQKGFRYLIDALEILRRDPSLTRQPVIAAFGAGGFVREEMAEIERRGLREAFINMPFTNDMPAVIKGVDLIAMPSLWEACPLLPMEALVTGTPIVGTSCIGLREVLRGTPALVVPPGDATALAAALKTYIDQPPRESFAQYQEAAFARFDCATAAVELRKLYDQLAPVNAGS